MNINIKYIIIMLSFYIVNAYSVPKQMAYWRHKRSFIYNTFLKDKSTNRLPFKYNFNNTKFYYTSYEILYEDFFQQHGEVSLLE